MQGLELHVLRIAYMYFIPIFHLAFTGNMGLNCLGFPCLKSFMSFKSLRVITEQMLYFYSLCIYHDPMENQNKTCELMF